MSDFAVTVEQIKEIKPHPNADKLELAIVKGWQCVVAKDMYKAGNLVVYIPVDSVLPVSLSDKIGVTNYLTKQRVRTVNLRGEYSQGLIVSRETIEDNFAYSVQSVGLDLTFALGITKYEAPIPICMQGVQRKANPRFFKYTNIENIKNFPDILEEGELVIISEKIHGTNARFAMIDGELYVGSHNVSLQDSESNLYWNRAREYDLANKIPEGVQLFGEIYGKGVQKLHYGENKPTLRFFDIMVDNKYMPYSTLLEFCTTYNLKTVPQITVTNWAEDLLSLGEGNSKLANHIREGIVIKPAMERTHPVIGRVIFKHINEKYLLKDYGDLH